MIKKAPRRPAGARPTTTASLLGASRKKRHGPPAGSRRALRGHESNPLHLDNIQTAKCVIWETWRSERLALYMLEFSILGHWQMSDYTMYTSAGR